MRFRILLAALFAMAALSVQAAIPTSEQTQVVEFYNQSLDHYFITTTAQEISDLDTGVHPGWVRTGYQFPAIWGGNSYPNTSPVCRFYGRPEAHLDSHFYSAKPSECDDVKNKFSSTWQYESPEVFRGFLVDPASGLCPVDTVPVYRLWNQRPDVNHRYTDQLSVYFYMVAKGYKPEGDGSPAFPVVFCTPAGGSVVPAPSAGAPDCTASASSATPVVGSTLSLNAQCTNNPTSFTWTGCTSSTSSCQVTQSAAGAAGYTVYASNAQGPATPVVRNVIWSTGAGAVPICAISTNTLTPTVGTPLALTVSCSQTPTRYDWMACDYAAPTNCTIMPACSTTSTSCSLVSGTPGFAHYAVSAANTAGTGARAGVDVEWKSSTGGGPPDPVPSCSILSTNTTPAINTAIVLIASCTGNPTSYAWTGLTCSASQCSTSSATVGTRTYSVIARNATGPSNVASTNVDWKASAPPPVPSCTLSASNTTPSPGQTITITSSCTNSPTSYAWTGCSSSGASCTDSVTTAGFKDYSVVAANGGGSGSQATVTVEWKVANTSYARSRQAT